MNINFYERVFRVTDCDDFTKEFYNYMGVPQVQAESIPVDNYKIHYDAKDVKISPPDEKEYKEYNEVKLHGGHPNKGLQ